ncbi:MAG: alpha/beta hydrolase [Chloroflexota bacterium]
MGTTNHSISTKDGRTLAVNEAGKPDGFPVLELHGTPGSGLLYQPHIEDANSQGIRLIGLDRPGYGGSTPLSGRSVASIAEDIATIAAQLNIDQLAVWGKSGGGPHALACAALLPELVVAAASIASPAPYTTEGLDWFAGMGQDNLDEFGAALDSRAKLEEYIEAETPTMLNADPKVLVEALSSILCPPDVAVFTEKFADFLLSKIRVGISDQRNGWVDDDLAFISPWGFDLGKIDIPVMIMQGEQDQMVPLSHAEWLISHIPTAEAMLLPDDGHLTLSANRIPEVHAWLMEKMAAL